MPSALMLKLIGYGLLALALTGAVAGFIHHQRELGAAPERARAVAAEQAASAVEGARVKERHTAAEIQEAQDAQIKNAKRAEADARGALAASQRLQQRAAALAGACSTTGASTPASGASGPADGAGYLLSDMLGRLDEAAGVLARRADARGGSGLLCERSFDALKP